MPTLQDLAQSRTDLAGADLDRLHLLLADWQLLADLSFADLVLWVPLRVDDGVAPGSAGFVAAGHVRPSTGPTAHHDDLVGTEAPRGRRPQLDRPSTSNGSAASATRTGRATCRSARRRSRWSATGG